MLSAKRFPSKFPVRPVVAYSPHGNKQGTIISDESDGSKEAAIYTLHVPFQWVSAFPRYFYRHSLEEMKGKQKEVWTTVSLEEAVTYLNVKEFRIKTTLTDRKTKMKKEDWPDGVDVMQRKICDEDLRTAQKSLQMLCQKILAGNPDACNDFLMYPHHRQNMFLLFATDERNPNFQQCMQRLKKHDVKLFEVISQHTMHYLKDVGLDLNVNESEWSNPDYDSDFYKTMNEVCSFQLVYYFPGSGSLLSHVDTILPMKLPGGGAAKREGSIHNLNFNNRTKYMDLFPVWQPHNTSDTSAEPAYRLETHFGQTTKLSGLNGRYRFSHAIPGGCEEEGITACWKWEEFNQKKMEEISKLIFVHDNANEVEDEAPRRQWRRDRDHHVKSDMDERDAVMKMTNSGMMVHTDLEFLLSKLEKMCTDTHDTV